MGDRQGEGPVNGHVLLCKGVEDSFAQGDRLSRLWFQLREGFRGSWGQLLQGSVLQLGQVLEEAQPRNHNPLVVLHLLTTLLMQGPTNRTADKQVHLSSTKVQ